MEQLTSLLILSGICNRILEVFKQWFGKLFPFSDDQKEAVWMTASMILGLGLVFAIQSERAIFAGIPVLQTLEPLVAKILAGILVGGGSNVIHSIIKIVNKPVDLSTLTVTATPSELTVTSTPTESIPLSEQSTPASPITVLDVMQMTDAQIAEIKKAIKARENTTVTSLGTFRGFELEKEDLT